ncbi:LETM1 AND EF-HAND DOMAIN-CONTAINING PROTEIN ANON-60DA, MITOCHONDRIAL [Ceraceosorus bombacis]|uniref:LETM1 AND EF-HAND DOMAIN-CONTAINING PROTEIN ANON-60DA, MITOCHONDRIAL n=1 Tax=Ceraceosorus bombacis TaxID=401625 RepID=A0A0P1BAQ8_9BASI|nr:LETM1 AND EF-HAND DOMAIN-CONTAINING PROTEIN ANON-60DA, MITOCHONDRIAL [Ceraceosorus bombacis]
MQRIVRLRGSTKALSTSAGQQLPAAIPPRAGLRLRQHLGENRPLDLCPVQFPSAGAAGASWRSIHSTSTQFNATGPGPSEHQNRAAEQSPPPHWSPSKSKGKGVQTKSASSSRVNQGSVHSAAPKHDAGTKSAPSTISTNATGLSSKHDPGSTSQKKPSAQEASPKAVTDQTSSGGVQTDDGARPTLLQRVQNLWQTMRFLFKFYWAGLKSIWANRTRAKEIQARVAARRAEGKLEANELGMNWEEKQLIQVHHSDMRKVPLFVAILLILEELLPLLVIYAPGLLPSTCILPSQAAKIRAKAEVARNTAVAHLREAQSAGGLPLQLNEGPDAEKEALSQLPAQELKDLARVFALPTWGTSALVARRLLKHAEYLRGDDEALHASQGISSWLPSGDDLLRAASERGLRASEVGSKELSGALRAYLKLVRSQPFNLLMPLKLYDRPTPAELLESHGKISAESEKGVFARTRDVVEEVVQEERSRETREERSEAESEAKRKREEKQ